MRWRAVPGLDIDKLAASKCLLLGAGTLGCNVARCLLAWGVRSITFVDNGRVSYSNPVRQSLFTTRHCSNGGVFKAQAASEALKDIVPDVDARGHVLTIPMPGHPLDSDPAEQKRVINDIEALGELVRGHDAVFLLTDSREARWLPTLLCAFYDKPLINAALGMDSFVVQRHGHRLFETSAPPPSPAEQHDNVADKSVESPLESELEQDKQAEGLTTEALGLGCYFCSDVVAPGDSSRDRTLDQQCTVTRPGLAYLAASLAVELFVSLTQHPQGHHAAVESPGARPSTCLGTVPHQLRGFLNRFDLKIVTGLAYDKCTACSPTILKEFKKQGPELVLKALGRPLYLEDLTGLTKLKEDLDRQMDDFVVCSEDDDF